MGYFITKISKTLLLKNWKAGNLGMLNTKSYHVKTFKTLLNQDRFIEAVHHIQFLLHSQDISEMDTWRCICECLELKQWHAAHMILRDALRMYPKNILFLKNTVILANKFGLYHEAFVACNQLLEVDQSLDSLLILGNTFEASKDYKNALKIYQKGQSCHPNKTHIYEALSRVYYKMGHNQDSLNILRLGISMHPNDSRLLLMYGNTLVQQNRYDLAERVYEHILEVDPKSISAQINLGVTKKELFKYDEAYALYANVIEQEPKNAGAYNNLGVLYKTEKKFLKACRSLKKALLLDSNNVDALANMGAILKETNKPLWAEFFYKKALLINPHHVNANVDYGIIKMLLEDYTIGMYHYEYRIHLKEFLPKRIDLDPKKRYNHQMSLDKKRILVYAEQGFGDAIQFVRFLPELKRKGAYVIVRVRPELERLFNNTPLADKIILENVVVEYDIHMPLLSVPYYLKIDILNYTISFPYMTFFQKNKKSINPIPKKIVFSFGGSSTHKGNVLRQIPPVYFEKLALSKDYELLSVQMGQDRDRLKACSFYHKIHDYADQIHDFQDTAEILSTCDLVITSDTSIAHLSGALGIQTWILLPINPDWRWGREKEKTFWYPSVELFRQSSKGSWKHPFEEIYTRLLGES